MYCGKCGAKNEPGATFCGTCGAPLETEKPGGNAVYGEPVTGAGTTAVSDSGKHKKVGIAAVAVVAVVAVFGIFSLFGGGRSAEETAEQSIAAALEGDTDAMLDLIPPKVLDLVRAAGYTEEEYVAELTDMAGELSAVAGVFDALGSEVKISYEAVEATQVSPDELSYLQEGYREEFDMTVDDAKVVEVELRLEAFGQSESQTLEIPVLKADGTWYLNLV